jgi:hypothetical protein
VQQQGNLNSLSSARIGDPHVNDLPKAQQGWLSSNNFLEAAMQTIQFPGLFHWGMQPSVKLLKKCHFK